MILFPLFSILSICRQIRVTKTISVSHHVSPNHEITFIIDTPSVTFLLPQRGSITADVYKLDINETYQFIGSLTPQIQSFGVYFPNKGKLILKSAKDTIANCYAIVSTRKCRRIYVSTYPNEIFSAVKPGFKLNSDKYSKPSNISIQNNQDVCFIHAANSHVKTQIHYSTEETYDLLYLHNGYTEREFTGEGEYETLAFNTSNFIWHSDPTTLSNYFTIRILSNSTLPGFRVNFTNTLSTPLFITDNKEKNNNQKPIYDHANADLLKLNRDHDVVSLITFSIFAFICSLFVVLGLLFITNRIFTNHTDDNEVLRRDESIDDDFSNQLNSFTPDIEKSPQEGDTFSENEAVDTSPTDYNL